MSRRLPTVLTNAETDALLVAARDAADQARTPTKQLAAWRDFVMIQTGLKAGPRISELCNLQLADIDIAGAVLSIKHGKGDKDRNVPIGDRLANVLKEWIGQRTSGYLFPGPKGKRLSPRTFQVRLAKLARAAGVLKDVHPHLFRHFFACSLIRTGATLPEVQELLGHEDLATTAIYLHVDTSRLKSAVDRL